MFRACLAWLQGWGEVGNDVDAKTMDSLACEDVHSSNESLNLRVMTRCCLKG
jgi:hypothetical protein